MLLGTHAGLPLILLAWRRVRAGTVGKDLIPTRYLIVTAIVGALPDLLNPHISLESRLSSWSHGLPFFALFTALLYLGMIPKRSPITWRWATFWSFAYGAHLFCDAISGGIAWKYPFGNEVWGDQWIPPGILWFASDFFFLIGNYILLRIVPMIQSNVRSAPR